MKYREYAYTGHWADGSLHTDTVYVAHPEPKQGCDTCGWTSSSDQVHSCGGPLRTLTMARNDDRIVYNVQDYPSEHLATTMDRQWAARWLRIRRTVPNAILTEGWFHRRTTDSVPNMPVDDYARANTVVLHDTGDGCMSGYGYKSGETAEGVRYTEQRLDCFGYDNFHFHVECDTHGTELVPNGSTDEECPDCAKVLDCINGNCDCINRLEACAICDRPQGNGDTVWLCLDGGEIICPEHVKVDERPDSLFKTVGGVRGAMLPAFAFPGGYCIVYLTQHNAPLCAECASKVDTSDPAVAAYPDEDMNCLDCDHAQCEHASGSANLAAVWTGTTNVGPCEADLIREDTYGREIMYLCVCTGYWPPVCQDCNKPIDPALRAWWAARKGAPVAVASFADGTEEHPW